MTFHIYDRIGDGYPLTRQPDPRIAARIHGALGDCESVVNVGAGTGSYEPRDINVIAVEPSATMIEQRPADAAPVIQGTAEQLPLGDGAVDAAMAILTLHHWRDVRRGLAEMRRVARRRIVILNWEQETWESFWLHRDYLPACREVDRRKAVAMDIITSVLGPCRVLPVPIPHDCSDGFHGAYWRRPHAYLDPRVRAGISTFAHLTPASLDEGLSRLRADIDSGAWHAAHRELVDQDELDLGYRLIVANAQRSS